MKKTCTVLSACSVLILLPSKALLSLLLPLSSHRCRCCCCRRLICQVRHVLGHPRQGVLRGGKGTGTRRQASITILGNNGNGGANSGIRNHDGFGGRADWTGGEAHREGVAADASPRKPPYDATSHAVRSGVCSAVLCSAMLCYAVPCCATIFWWWRTI